MKQIRIISYIILALALFGFTSKEDQINNEPINEATKKQIIEYLKGNSESFFDLSKGSGLALAILDGKASEWIFTSGELNKTSTINVDKQSIFRLESVSKNITTLAILVAVEEGLLSLDKPLKEYLPDFSINSQFEKSPFKKMTLRHLLSHTSGFTHHAPVGNYHDSNPHTWDEHINSIQSTWLLHTVGSKFSYSNLNIDLAAFILETVTKTKFPDWVDQKVLAPLKMMNTTFDFEKIKLADNHLYGYSADGNYTIPGPIRSPMLASGGCFSTLEDLMKLAKFYLNRGNSLKGQLISSSLLTNEMFDIKFEYPGQNGYSFGFDKTHITAENYVLTHTGSGYGFRSMLMIIPSLDLGIVLLYNCINQALISKIRSDINEIIKSNSKSPYILSFKDALNDLTKVSKWDKRLENLAGTYYPSWMSIQKKEDSLILDAGSMRAELNMFEDRNGNFVCLIGERSLLTFKNISNSAPIMMDWLVNDGNIINTTFDIGPNNAHDPDKNSTILEKWLGDYHSYTWILNEKIDISISFKNGYLYVDDMRCKEVKQDLLSTPDGRILDLRSDYIFFDNRKFLK